MSRRHQDLHASNQELSAFNQFSAEQHARLSGRFAKHVGTLQEVHGGLLNIFRRVRALRTRLIAAHPELAELAAAADARREAEIEQARNETRILSDIHAEDRTDNRTGGATRVATELQAEAPAPVASSEATVEATEAGRAPAREEEEEMGAVSSEPLPSASAPAEAPAGAPAEAPAGAPLGEDVLEGEDEFDLAAASSVAEAEDFDEALARARATAAWAQHEKAIAGAEERVVEAPAEEEALVVEETEHEETDLELPRVGALFSGLAVSISEVDAPSRSASRES